MCMKVLAQGHLSRTWFDMRKFRVSDSDYILTLSIVTGHSICSQDHDAEKVAYKSFNVERQYSPFGEVRQCKQGFCGG